MTVREQEQKQQQQPIGTPAQVRLSHATWSLPPVAEHSSGTPRKPGFGARLAVRKFSATLNKLAES